MKRDLIISCFAVPPQPAAKALAFGADWGATDPVIYNVGKTGNWDLSALKQEGGGSILTAILNRAMNPFKTGKLTFEWGRVALVSFSEGTSAARQIMVNPNDWTRIDAFISLDSTAVAKTMPTWDAQGFGWSQYSDFGLMALDGSALQVMLHTDIINKNPDVASTSDTAARIFSSLEEIARPVNDAARQNGTVSPFDFVPGYQLNRLNDGPKYFAGPDAHVEIVQQIGNNWRLRLPSPIAYTTQCKRDGVCQADGVMVCDGGVGCAHSACAVDYQRAIYDTYLAPRWRNPEQFACAGSGCIRPSKDNVLSGVSGLGEVYRPATNNIDNDALASQFAALGLPSWGSINRMLVAGGAALAAGAVTYRMMKD